MEVYKDLILAVLVLKLQIVGLSIINNELYKNSHFSCDTFNKWCTGIEKWIFNWINVLILDCSGGCPLNYLTCGLKSLRTEDDEDVIPVSNFRPQVYECIFYK